MKTEIEITNGIYIDRELQTVKVTKVTEKEVHYNESGSGNGCMPLRLFAENFIKC